MPLLYGPDGKLWRRGNKLLYKGAGGKDCCCDTEFVDPCDETESPRIWRWEIEDAGPSPRDALFEVIGHMCWRCVPTVYYHPDTRFAFGGFVATRDQTLTFNLVQINGGAALTNTVEIYVNGNLATTLICSALGGSMTDVPVVVSKGDYIVAEYRNSGGSGTGFFDSDGSSDRCQCKTKWLTHCDGCCYDFVWILPSGLSLVGGGLVPNLGLPKAETKIWLKVDHPSGCDYGEVTFTEGWASAGAISNGVVEITFEENDSGDERSLTMRYVSAGGIGGIDGQTCQAINVTQNYDCGRFNAVTWSDDLQITPIHPDLSSCISLPPGRFDPSLPLHDGIISVKNRANAEWERDLVRDSDNVRLRDHLSVISPDACEITLSRYVVSGAGFGGATLVWQGVKAGTASPIGTYTRVSGCDTTATYTISEVAP